VRRITKVINARSKENKMSYKAPYQLEALQAYLTEMTTMASDFDMLAMGHTMEDPDGFAMVTTGINKALKRAVAQITGELSAHYNKSATPTYAFPDVREEYVATAQKLASEFNLDLPADFANAHAMNLVANHAAKVSNEEELKAKPQQAVISANTYLSFYFGGKVTPKAAPVVCEEEPSVEEPSCGIVETQSMTAQETDMSLFSGYQWWSDDDHNGNAADIFKYVLEADPNTCDIDTFIKGLLYARVERDTGKDGSLRQDELLALCHARGFSEIPPAKGKGKAALKPIVDRVKATGDFSKKALKDITKSGFPTHAFYREDFLEKSVYTFETPELVGDNLESICEGIDPDSLELKSDYEAQAEPAPEEVVEDPVVEEPKPEPKKVVTTATQRALERLGLA
jgi:hypothetical protein